MAKILIVGSRKAHDLADFQAQCKKIGVALANAGHTIVAAGCADSDAETWVLEGANSASSPSTKTAVIPYSPALPRAQELLACTPACSARWPNLLFQPELRIKGEWAVGQAVALLRSDLALLIGGGLLTANTGSLALEIGKPYLAVESMGGAAEVLAKDDYSKYKVMQMPDQLRSPDPGDPDFGKKVLAACEFMMQQARQKEGFGKSIVLLLVSLAVLASFLAYVFRENILAYKAQLLYTSSFGALVGVILSLLIGHVIRNEPIDVAAVIRQSALASFLGVLYGFFALEAGSFYKVDINLLKPDAFQSLTENMAFVGVAVGVLLSPAAKKILEELSRVAKITDNKIVLART